MSFLRSNPNSRAGGSTTRIAGPRHGHTALALGLGLLGLLVAGPSFAITQVLYDVDFGHPHLPGFGPIEGAEPIPRYLVSEVKLGTPLVVEEEGLLQDQPLLLDSSDSEGDQIAFELTDVPGGDYYTLEAWVLVSEADEDGGLTVFFDSPNVRTITFHHDDTVAIFVPGEAAAEGEYTVGTPVFLQVAIDLEHDYWSIRLDGSQIHEGPYGGASLIESIRMSNPLGGSNISSVVAIDDVVITSGREDACDRLGFGDLVVGREYVEGETFETDGVFVTVGPHYNDLGPCGGATTSTFARVESNGAACGMGKELNLNNVTLDFDFGGPVREVVIPYGFYGGTISLSVNGECQTVALPRDLNGINLGGVAVTVWDFDLVPQGCGVIRLGGTVDQLSVSGQEFFIDNLSYCLECETDRRSAFEDQTLGDTFTVGDEFSSGGATHTLFPYFPAGASCINPDDMGIAEIENGGESCVDGTELHLDDINTRIDFGADVNWIVLGYGESSGNVNIRINEDCRNLTNLSDVTGSVIGGVTVWAQDFGPAGSSCGQLYAVGPIGEFAIGGDSIWIDNIRACREAVSHVEEGLPSEPGPSVRLLESAPNPMRNGTTVRFELARSERVRLDIFSAGGRRVRSLVNGNLAAGRHDVDWDGRDDAGTPVPSGIYWTRAAGDLTGISHRLVVLR